MGVDTTKKISVDLFRSIFHLIHLKMVYKVYDFYSKNYKLVQKRYDKLVIYRKYKWLYIIYLIYI